MDSSKRFESLFEFLRVNALIILAALGFGLSRGCGDWAVSVMHTCPFEASTGINIHLFIDAGKILGIILLVALSFRLDPDHRSLPLFVAPGVVLACGCLCAFVCSSLPVTSVSPFLGVCVLVGAGTSMLLLQWLEFCSRIPPRDTVLALSLGYVVNFLFSFYSLGAAVPAAFVVSTLIAGLLCVLLAYSYERLPRSPSQPATWSRTPSDLTTVFRNIFPLLLIVVFSFAYGLGDSATELGRTTLVAKIGGIIPPLIFIALIALIPEKIDLATVFSVALVFMVAGLVVAPFSTSIATLAQCLLSASIGSCYILGYMLACMPAYQDGSSSMASCGILRAVVIVLSTCGAYIGSVLGHPAFDVLIGVTIVLLIVVFLVNNTRGLSPVPHIFAAADDTESADPLAHALEQASRNNLSERELTVYGMTLAGKSVKEISQELFITPSAVRAHLSRIYTKFGVHSVQELIDAVK